MSGRRERQVLYVICCIGMVAGFCIAPYDDDDFMLRVLGCGLAFLSTGAAAAIYKKDREPGSS